MPLETRNLVVNYPDFADPGEASKHAEILQRAYDAYWQLHAFGGDDPFRGRTTAISFDVSVARSVTVSPYEIRMGTGSFILLGLTNPPTPTYFHELAHAFQYAQRQAGLTYIFHLVAGINEALADHFAYYFGHEVLKYSAEEMRGYEDRRAKAIDQSLRQYEGRKLDPYELDWGAHAEAETYLLGMFFRIVERCGWELWPRFFASQKSPLASRLIEQKVSDMRDARVKEAFDEFVGGLSKACGQNLRPMFRSWRFEL